MAPAGSEPPDGSVIAIQNASLFAITPLAVSPDEVTKIDNFDVVYGVSRDDEGRPDVMRGEETQILGCGVDGTICLPGTHSKWVQVGDRAIASIRTAMTGTDDAEKQLELVTARNQAEALVHSVRKSLKDYGDKLDAGEKEKIEAAIKDAEGVLKSEDKAEIDAKASALAQAAQTLGQKMYADQEKAAAEAAAGGPGSAQQPESGKKDENVVDAEFTEVKDKKTGS